MIGCIIQARMGSSRLPGKTLMKVDQKNTILDYVINQLSYSKLIDKIIIATTDLPEDDIICELLISKKINFFRGSSENVLDRYFQCAKKYSIDIIIRITADNPLIDPMIIDMIIEQYKKRKCDFITNTIHRTFPYGTEVEIFSYKILEKTWKKAEKYSEKEHVTPFMKDVKNKFHLENIENNQDISNFRYTVDQKEDLIVVKEIIKNIHSRPILMEDILNLYKKNQKVFEINKDIKHDGYQKSLKKDEHFFKSYN